MKDAAALAALQETRLRRTMTTVAAAHPFYRERLRASGINAGDIRSLTDLAALPLTTKDDYIADPEAFRLHAADLPPDFSAEERVLWDVAYTTGTTSGRPSPFYNTTHDQYAIMDQARRCNAAEGLTSADRIANLYPLANFPTGAFLSVVRSAMVGGMAVVHGLTGSANSEFKVRHSLAEALHLIEQFRPTVLWGVPSFIRRFLDAAVASGADLSSVRLVLMSGEPVGDTLRGTFRSLLACLGAPAVTFRARYAFTEMQGGLVQAAEGAAVQNVCPDLYFLEAVDPDTGTTLPDGEPGMLALTHLHRRGTVLLRYLVGDMVALSHAPCPLTGRLGERVISTPRRTGALVKCRGMLVNTSIILDMLATMPGIGEFQIAFERDAADMDALVIRIERYPGEETERVQDTIVEQVRRAVSIRPDVRFEPPGTLYNHEQSIKVRRVVDLRPTPE